MSNKEVVENVESNMFVKTVDKRGREISATKVNVGKKKFLQTKDEVRYVFIKALGGDEWHFSHRYYHDKELGEQQSYSNYNLPGSVERAVEEELGGCRMYMRKPEPEVVFNGKEIEVTGEMVEKYER